MDKHLEVFYHKDKVGTLALTTNHVVAFEYCEQWLKNGFSISPFSLPLKKQVFIPSKPYFDGLFGVFADSLPDAWGNLLLNRLLLEKGISRDSISVIERLAMVGSSGMGALTYQPEKEWKLANNTLDLDVMAEHCKRILANKYSENLDELYLLGGSSGGARPKILTEIDGHHWMIKFPAHVDGADAGSMEYEYSCCAKKCKIDMPETKLFPSKNCKGYFGVQRFDRDKNQSIHMCTAAALLELDFREPSLDYHSLLKLTKILTKDNLLAIEQMYRRMCFNVWAHNRDDHSKNFTFLYNHSTDSWQLSPAYDLTYSNTYFGEHTTTVDGNGKNPGMKELIQVGTTAGLDRKDCENISCEIKELVDSILGQYIHFS